MTIGMNLGGVNYYSPEAPLIDRMLTAGEVSAKFTTAPYDPNTLLPAAAGNVARAIMLDPGTHDYVILFEGPATRFVVNGTTKAPIISGNRATFTATETTGGTQITVAASGPVTKLAVMRAEHEAAYQKGEQFNPDFLARVSPFKLIRTLDWSATNLETYPARRPLPGDPFFQDTHGGFPHEFGAMLCAKTGAKLWAPMHHMMTDAQVFAALAGMDRVATGDIDLEWSNEFGWTYHRTWAYAQAGARYNIANPQPLDMLRYYGFRAGSLANLAASISNRFKVNLSAQPSNTPDKSLAAILAGWDEAKAPHSLIAGFANGGYLNFNYPPTNFTKLLALQAANDVEGFYAMAQGLIPALAARHQVAAKASAAVGLAYKVYEYNVSVYAQAPNIVDATARAAFIAWITPLIHTDRMADILMQVAKAATDNGAVEACFYQFSGSGSQYGIWGAMPHPSLPAYQIYDRLAAAAAAPPLPTMADELAGIRASMADNLARLDGLIARG